MAKKLFFVIIVCFAMVSCGKHKITGPEVQNHFQEKGLGLIPVPEDLYNSIPLALPPSTGVLPSSYDLSSNFPEPGDQGTQGSCVGWAVAYALKSYQEKVERNWDLSSQEHLFSPAYIYNQIPHGENGGSSILDALNLVQQEGCATLSLMPYYENNYSIQPSSIVKSFAYQYRISFWRKINHASPNEVKAHLYGGYPIIICVEVGSNFSNTRKSNPYKSTGTSRGYHAVVVTGYDNVSSTFKFINSWGTDYNGTDDGKGFGYIAYSFFPTAVRQAFVVYDLTETGEREIVIVSMNPGNNSTLSLPATLSWSCTNEDIAVQYEIEISNSEAIYSSTGRFQSIIITGTPSVKEYIVNGLNDGAYYWHVRAKNSLTNSWNQWSAVRSFNVESVLGIPSLSSPLNGSNINNPVRLQWVNGNNAESHLWEVSQNSTIGSDGNFTNLLYSGTTSNGFRDLPSLSSGSYYWHVASVKGSLRKWSNIWSFSVQDPSQAVTVTDAYLRMYRGTKLSGSEFDAEIYAVSGPWTESLLNWSNKPANSSSKLTSEYLIYNRPNNYDTWNGLTDVVNAWVNGALENNGIVIIPYSGDISGDEWFTFKDRNDSQKPELRIAYTKNGQNYNVTLNPVVDVFVIENDNANHNSDNFLMIGKSNSKEIRIYLRFNLSSVK